jgi:hypothetical protein
MIRIPFMGLSIMFFIEPKTESQADQSGICRRALIIESSIALVSLK